MYIRERYYLLCRNKLSTLNTCTNVTCVRVRANLRNPKTWKSQGSDARIIKDEERKSLIAFQNFVKYITLGFRNTYITLCRVNNRRQIINFLINKFFILTSIRKVHPSKLSSLRVAFLANAWQSSFERWSSRANRGLDRSSSWRHCASVRASTSGITSVGLDAPAALRASRLRALLTVSPRQQASRPPRRHLDTFKDLSLQFGSLWAHGKKRNTLLIQRKQRDEISDGAFKIFSKKLYIN